MRCLKCKNTVRTPTGRTRETQICGTCRGVFKGRPRSRIASKVINSGQDY